MRLPASGTDDAPLLANAPVADAKKATSVNATLLTNAMTGTPKRTETMGGQPTAHG